MAVEIDADVEAAALILQASFPAARLVAITAALSDLAPVLWGRHGRELVAPAILISQAHAGSEPKAAKG